MTTFEVLNMKKNQKDKNEVKVQFRILINLVQPFDYF